MEERGVMVSFRTIPNFNTTLPLNNGVMLIMGTPHVLQKYLCRCQGHSNKLGSVPADTFQVVVR